MAKRVRRRLLMPAKAQKPDPHDRMTRMIIILVAIILLGAIGIVLWHDQFGTEKSQTNQAVILAWPREKVLASPKNTATFLKARLSYIADRIPEGLSDAASSPQTTKEVIRELVNSNEFEKSNELIRTARIHLDTTTQRKLTLLPDWHIDARLSPDRKDRVVHRQRWISQIISEKKPRLVFAEGIEGPITWETLLEGARIEAQRHGYPSPITLGGFKRFIRDQGSFVWFSNFLDTPEITIYGYDPEKVVVIGSIFANYSPPESEPELREIWEDTRILLTITYREQVIVANCITQMRGENLNSAYIVLGEGHLNTFPVVCKNWGVELQIIEPPE